MIKEVYRRNQIANAYLSVICDRIEERVKNLLDIYNKKAEKEIVLSGTIYELETVHDELQALSTMLTHIDKLLYYNKDEDNDNILKDVDLDNL